jgi:hypothetical protein
MRCILDTFAVFPFRWDITKPNQIGRLLDNNFGESPYHYADFLADLTACCAKVLAQSANSHLYFVGRSPDDIYDYLSGILEGTYFRDRLHLLHFSMFYEDVATIIRKEPQALAAFYAYLQHLQLDPLNLIQRSGTITLVDIVSRGTTLGNFIKLLQHWCGEIGVAWEAIKPKLRIIAIVRAPYHTQKYLRQEATWLNHLKPKAIKRVITSKRFWSALGDHEIKVSISYTPKMWGDEQVRQPYHTTMHLAALRQALALYEQGQKSNSRRELVRYMSREQAVRYRWFRKLLLEINK